MSPGDILGDVLHSDIVAYINGHAIPTSIKDGTTMVVVEDLRNYGFDVTWCSEEWALFIEPSKAPEFDPLTVEASNMPVGTFKMHYVYTTIRTFLSGEPIDSFAIDGQTLIDFELLAQYGDIEWDGEARALRLTLAQQELNPVPTPIITPAPTPIPTPTPAVTPTPVPTASPPAASAMSGVLNRFGYRDLTVRFVWDNFILENQIGWYELHCTITGDMSRVANILIGSSSVQTWTDAAILNAAEWVITAWRRQIELPHSLGNDNRVHNRAFIMPEDLGRSGYSLVFVLDEYYEPLGHVLIPVTIPSTAGN
jgi:hypothetical protein